MEETEDQECSILTSSFTPAIVNWTQELEREFDTDEYTTLLDDIIDEIPESLPDEVIIFPQEELKVEEHKVESTNSYQSGYNNLNSFKEYNRKWKVEGISPSGTVSLRVGFSSSSSTDSISSVGTYIFPKGIFVLVSYYSTLRLHGKICNQTSHSERGTKSKFLKD
jgi:hypothetical protein